MTTTLKSELRKTQILSELRTYSKKLEGGFSSDSLSDDLEISKQSIESARHRGIEGVIYHYNDVNYLAVFDILQSKIIKDYNSVDNENNKIEVLESLFNDYKKYIDNAILYKNDIYSKGVRLGVGCEINGFKILNILDYNGNKLFLLDNAKLYNRSQLIEMLEEQEQE